MVICGLHSLFFLHVLPIVSKGIGLAGGKERREIFIKVQASKKTVLKTRHVKGPNPLFSELVILYKPRWILLLKFQ